MRIGNWEQLRNAVAESQTFDMKDFLHPCGTPACLLGHVAAIMIKDDITRSSDETLQLRQKLLHSGDLIIADWLGIGLNQLPSFYCGDWSKGVMNTTQQDALEWIDECITKGYVTRLHLL